MAFEEENAVHPAPEIREFAIRYASDDIAVAFAFASSSIASLALGRMQLLQQTLGLFEVCRSEHVNGPNDYPLYAHLARFPADCQPRNQYEHSQVPERDQYSRARHVPPTPEGGAGLSYIGRIVIHVFVSHAITL
jgi:hypothetical protein